jgi:hypothetical protein
MKNLKRFFSIMKKITSIFFTFFVIFFTFFFLCEGFFACPRRQKGKGTFWARASHILQVKMCFCFHVLAFLLFFLVPSSSQSTNAEPPSVIPPKPVPLKENDLVKEHPNSVIEVTAVASVPEFSTPAPRERQPSKRQLEAQGGGDGEGSSSSGSEHDHDQNDVVRSVGIKEQVAVIKAVAENNFFAAPHGFVQSWEKRCIDQLAKEGFTWNGQRIRRFMKKTLAEYEAHVQAPDKPTGNNSEWITSCANELSSISRALGSKASKKVWFAYLSGVEKRSLTNSLKEKKAKKKQKKEKIKEENAGHRQEVAAQIHQEFGGAEEAAKSLNLKKSKGERIEEKKDDPKASSEGTGSGGKGRWQAKILEREAELQEKKEERKLLQAKNEEKRLELEAVRAQNDAKKAEMDAKIHLKLFELMEKLGQK